MPGKDQPTLFRIRFASFEADLKTQELKKNGVRLRLPGLARLVVVPEEERTRLEKTLEGVRYVATYSFRLLREERHQEN